MDLYRLERDLIRDEGFKVKPYRCTSGHWTIGVGHKMLPLEIESVKELTSDEIFALLANDVRLAIAGCYQIFGRNRFERMDDCRQRALANMCFQLGIAGLAKFERMIAAIFNEDWQNASKEALDSKWAKHDSPARAKRVADMLRTGCNDRYIRHSA